VRWVCWYGGYSCWEREKQISTPLYKVNRRKQQFTYFCFEVGVYYESSSYYAKEHKNHTHEVLGFVSVMVTGGGEKFNVPESGGGALWHFWGTIVHFEVVIRVDRLQKKQCPVIFQVTWIVLAIGRRYV
jgi:hypothetical protein